MDRILYLAELFSRVDFEPYVASVTNDFDQTNQIFYFDNTRDETSYWVTTWGGYFDGLETTEIQILLVRRLEDKSLLNMPQIIRISIN